jgi:hypothetical protein
LQDSYDQAWDNTQRVFFRNNLRKDSRLLQHSTEPSVWTAGPQHSCTKCTLLDSWSTWYLTFLNDRSIKSYFLSVLIAWRFTMITNESYRSKLNPRFVIWILRVWIQNEFWYQGFNRGQYLKNLPRWDQLEK